MTGTASDAAGNTATVTVSGLDVDLTKPAVTFSGNAGAYSVDQMVAITCTATDGLSLIDAAHTTCPGASGPAYIFTLGINTLTATATDKAGNVATASATFAVAADETSLCALTRRFVSRANLARELCAVLRVAELAREHGLVNARRALLNGYARAIKEIRGRYITPEDADVLIALAARI